MSPSMKVPQGYEKAKREYLEELRKREKFEKETEPKTKEYIA